MHSHTHHLPTLSQLFKATGIALVIAAVILITAVLPAEFGIDPTGIGKALSLTTLKTPGDAPVVAVAVAAIAPPSPIATPPVTSAQTVAVANADVPFRSDEMTLTLQPGEGTEIKASMLKDAQFVFTWATTGGKVNFDMHGEPPNAGANFTSYLKGKEQTLSQGTFIAPFDGTHGWFWRNRGDQPVTVNVKVSGFYEKLAQR